MISRLLKVTLTEWKLFDDGSANTAAAVAANAATISFFIV